MENDEFQKERPQIQKEPSLSDARSETRLPLADDNRFHRPDPVRNWTALIAFWLGVLCLIGPPSLFAYGSTLGFLTDSFKPWVAWALYLAWVLGPAALIFGILGLGVRYRHPTAGGIGYAIFGIVIGIPICLLGVAVICILTGTIRVGFPGGGWK